ncbi:MAG TPA: DMT family transporter [Kofleriaceae bacterium]|nr:DMT family transporter [Kofleriaceae bacterium]
MMRGPLLLVAFGAAAISFAPVLVKVAALEGVGPATIGAWRCAIGGALLVALAMARGAPLLPRRSAVRIALIAGVAFALDLWVWHRSIVIVGAGMATILGNTQVFWTSAYGGIAYREPLSPRFLAAAGAAFVGVVLLAGIGSDVELSRYYLGGVGLGLATGLVYACYILAVQRATGGGRTGAAVEEVGPRSSQLTQSMHALGWVALIAGALLGTSAAIEGEALVPPTARAWLALGGLAVVAQIIGWIAIASGLRRAPASRAALVLLLQPALATGWGFAFFDERLQLLQLAGAVVTLTAIYLGATVTRSAR